MFQQLLLHACLPHRSLRPSLHGSPRSRRKRRRNRTDRRGSCCCCSSSFSYSSFLSPLFSTTGNSILTFSLSCHHWWKPLNYHGPKFSLTKKGSSSWRKFGWTYVWDCVCVHSSNKTALSLENWSYIGQQVEMEGRRGAWWLFAFHLILTSSPLLAFLYFVGLARRHLYRDWLWEWEKSVEIREMGQALEEPFNLTAYHDCSKRNNLISSPLPILTSLTA